MRRHSILFYVNLALGFIGLIAVLIFIYTLKLRDVVEENILYNIRETAQHDKRAIETSIGLFLDELAGVAKRMDVYGCKTIHEMEVRLNLECSTTSFTHLYVLAQDGKIYTDKFVVYEPGAATLAGRIDLGSLFAKTTRKEIVARFDDKAEFAGISRESIVYGVRLEDFKVDKEPMQSLFGITDINFLQDHLIIDNFVIDGQAHGFSSVIDMAGNYIVGRNRSVYLNDSPNFFRNLEAGNSSISIDDARKLMAAGESFTFHYSEDQQERLVYLSPFKQAGDVPLDWYLVISINNEILEGRQMRFAIMGLSLLGIVVVSLLALMIYVMLARQRLYKANEAIKVRSEFLSNMSHEIRTPLNGLIGLNYLITSHVGEPGRLPQLKIWLAKSKSLADYLLALLNDILDMSKLQAGKVDIINAPFSVDSLLDDIWFMQSGNAERRGVNMTLDKNLIHPWVWGDETRLKQILTNIVGNAVKFTPEGGSITIGASQRKLPDGRIETVYTCKDTGKGMSADFLSHIFDPFAQEGMATSDMTLKGTGLGMPISHELALAMGGEIEVISTLGEGSTFIVRIPGKPADPPDSGEQTSARKARLTKADDTTTDKVEAEIQPLKILLVEDAEFNAEFLMEVLEEEGFEAVHAENGQIAVDIFKESEPGEFDVILMDMQMPVMDGCTAAATIRSLERPDAGSVWIYACTANTFKEDMDRAMASGMNDFLTKPIDIKVFLQKMNNREIQKNANPKRKNNS